MEYKKSNDFKLAETGIEVENCHKRRTPETKTHIVAVAKGRTGLRHFPRLQIDKENISNKNSFMRKKSNRPRAALDLVTVEKGEGIPNNTAPRKKLPPTISRELQLRPSVRIRGPNCKGRKNIQQMAFVTRF